MIAAFLLFILIGFALVFCIIVVACTIGLATSIAAMAFAVVVEICLFPFKFIYFIYKQIA